jgi:ligand-binding sensor domain-containing protein
MAGSRSGERMAQLRISEFAAVIGILFLIAISCAASPEDPVFPGTTTNTPDYSITFFVPSENSIHSDQINDMINGNNGSVIIGTSFGLSMYNGTWSTRHINRNNISEGLMNDYITAVENDNKGNLWIGYSGGIQIFSGVYYQSIRDQQLLKDPRITDLQRWNDDIWVATGNAGIHRYRDGAWKWFQPDTRGGSPFFTVTSMAIDTTGENSSLVIATHDEGLWLVRSPDDPVRFETLNAGDSVFDPLRQVRRDPGGGVYLFNGSEVVHYSAVSGFTSVLSNSDLAFAPIRINDVSSARDGTLYLATDDGIYIWRDGGVIRRISSFDGIGPTNIVKFIWVDNENRAWYASQGYVGFYYENPVNSTLIPIEQVTEATIPVPVTAQPGVSVTTPVITPEPTHAPGLIVSIFDPLIQAIRALAGKFGVILPGIVLPDTLGR